jgi:hypothetical protein
MDKQEHFEVLLGAFLSDLEAKKGNSLGKFRMCVLHRPSVVLYPSGRQDSGQTFPVCPLCRLDRAFEGVMPIRKFYT